MLVVAAIGTSVLEPRGSDEQRDRAIRRAARAIADLTADNDIVVVHGGAGYAVRVASAETPTGLSRLDVIDAAVAGMVGAKLDQALRNAVPGRPVATLLTPVVVDPDDPEFDVPTRFLGPVLSEAGTHRAAELHWRLGIDGGSSRRMVPRPAPIDVLGMAAIRHLALAHVLVVCGGAGGVPVVVDPGGILHAVEAVVETDLTAALIATRLCADRLLLLTDTDGVRARDGSPLASLAVTAARELRLDPATMGLKVEAACRFAERSGGTAVIGAIGDAAALLRGECGTTVHATARASGTGAPNSVGVS